MHHLVYRIMWLRAKQRQDRWLEEVQQSAADLLMARTWFETYKLFWINKAIQAAELNKPGHISFAYKQANDFQQLFERSASFVSYIRKYFEM